MDVRSRLSRRVAGSVAAAVVALGTALPAGAAAAAAPSTVRIDDGARTGANRFAYTGVWSACRDCRRDALGRSFRYTNRRGATVRLTFVGTRAVLYGLRQPAGGIATVTVDGRSRGRINFTALRSAIVPVWTSPVLRQGTHTVVLTVTNRTTGRGHTIGIDGAAITSTVATRPGRPAPPQNPPPQNPPPQNPPPQSPPPAGGSGGAAASLTFDDAKVEHATVVAPMLQAAGVRGTFYVISDAMSWGGGSMSAAQVRALAAAGHEIGNHTRDHANLTSLGRAQVEAEFADAQAAIRERAGVTPTTCAYPYGAVDATVEAVAAKYFTACRGTSGGTNGSGTDRYALRTFYVHTSTTADQVRAAAQSARNAGAWIVFVYHGVGKVGSSDDVTTASLSAQLDAIRGTGIPIRTVAQALAR
jgi:Polysaccharide deacetylase